MANVERKSGGRRKKNWNSKKSDEVQTESKGSRNPDDIKSNDINWYNKMEPYFSDAVKVPFNRIVGDKVNLFENINVNGNTGLRFLPEAVPGIMRIEFVPTIGLAKTARDPINRSFNTMYSELVSRTSNSQLPFQQADLALFMMGMASPMMLIGFIKRIMGLPLLKISQNVYYPQTLCESMGINYDDLIANHTNYRTQLNDCITDFNAMKVPNFLDIFLRYYQLTSNIYTDEDSVLGQLYHFCPKGYYLYDDSTSSLQFKVMNTTMANIQPLSYYINIVDTMLEAWRNSSDLLLIRGTIERAFKDNAYLVIEMQPQDTISFPVYDRIMLYQINNLKSYPYTGFDPTSLNITQDPAKNLLLFNPRYNTSSYVNNMVQPYSRRSDALHIINSFDGDSSPEFIMESTRLMAILDREIKNDIIATNSYYNWYTMGTELVTDIFVTNYINDGDGNYILGETKIPERFDATSTASSYSVLYPTLDILTKFRNAPRVPMWYLEGGNYTFGGFVGDLYRFTTIDATGLDGLNKAALQSIYTVQIQASLN